MNQLINIKKLYKPMIYALLTFSTLIYQGCALSEPRAVVWVSINDPGISGHEGFKGQMSKYETTNAQYCQYLNAAKDANQITVSDDTVYATSDTGHSKPYYYLAGPGDDVTKGGAARINWTGSTFTVDAGFENHPATYVSWYGATAFASYYGWRLPTEWEWQAVADFDGTYTYGHGPGTINNSLANYENSSHPYGTTAVGSYGTIHGYGMCDMAGNVWEWTSSLYPGTSFRVIRGGCWSYNDQLCAVSLRNYIDPYYTLCHLGFRVCR